MLKCTPFIALFLLIGPALVPGGGSRALADTQKTKHPPTFFVLTMESVVVSSIQSDGSGQDVYLSGRLHLESTVTTDDSGNITQFDLHANLMGASVMSQDGTEDFIAEGSDDLTFNPPSPIPLPYPNVGWVLTFHCASGSHFKDAILYLRLPVRAIYDDTGELIDAVPVGEITVVIP